VYPVPQELKSSLLHALLERDVMREALVFTRTKHRANRLWEFLEKRGVSVARIHGNRSQSQRTDALDGFKGGRYRVLVATDIAARGIDVEALGHVVNFDVPMSPDDYIHRVGRTARAELTGEAFTFAAPEEAEELRAIERAVGKALVRVTVPDFDYNAKPAGRFEIPIRERLAKMRGERAEARERSKARKDRGRGATSAAPPARPSRGGTRPVSRPSGDSPYRSTSASAPNDGSRDGASASRRGSGRGPRRGRRKASGR
jgi:ATP-dependent RNA helicase RhlE